MELLELAGESLDEQTKHFSMTLARSLPDLLVLGRGRNSSHAFDAQINWIRRCTSSLPVFVIADVDTPEEIRELLRAGAADFLTPPLTAKGLLPRLWRLIADAQSCDPLLQHLKEKSGFRNLVGRSPQFLAEVRKIPCVARCDSNVLITGETGSGKEVLAQAIHFLGPRTNKAFIPVNSGAIPVDLLENELFGHESGAYTHASAPAKGLIREAEGGTLFLDEVECLSLSAQAKLLRFLQEREVRPLGSGRVYRLDVRVIAAANVDLPQAVKEGRFRHDLFYRLNVIPFHLPPLRQRTEDIPVLAHHFLRKFAGEHAKPLSGFTDRAVQKLLRYEWPGNVRELENVLERAVIFCEDPMLDAYHLDLPGLPGHEDNEGWIPLQVAKSRVVAQFEQQYIRKKLSEFQGNVTRAARAAGKHPRAFLQLIRKHNIEVLRPNSRCPADAP